MPIKTQGYGEWVVGGDAPISPLPLVGRIYGGRVELDGGKPSRVRIQYEGPVSPLELSMDFPNAMFLLSLLKSIQLDSGFPFPDDPRA
jgi:hypothetical protein